MDGIWDYILTGGHLYKKSYWRKEYERIAREKDVSPDYVYAIAQGAYLKDETDRAIKEALRKAGVFSSIMK